MLNAFYSKPERFRSKSLASPFSMNGKLLLLWGSFSIFIKNCNVLELVDNFDFLISFFFDKFIC